MAVLKSRQTRLVGILTHNVQPPDLVFWVLMEVVSSITYIKIHKELDCLQQCQLMYQHADYYTDTLIII